MAEAPEDDTNRTGGGPSTVSATEGKIKDTEKSERKLTVLETYGYALGRTIGAGSYATVKVSRVLDFPPLKLTKIGFHVNLRFQRNEQCKYFKFFT